MCDPISGTILGITGIVGSLVGGGLSAYGSYQQGRAANDQAKAEANQALQQAKMEQSRGEMAQLQGELERNARSRQLAADIGSAYANYAGNGLLVDGGSKDTLGSILTTQVSEASRDLSIMRENTAMDVWGHQANAVQFRNTAAARRAYGKNAKRAGILSAIGTGIGAIGSAAGSAAMVGGDLGWFKSSTIK